MVMTSCAAGRWRGPGVRGPGRAAGRSGPAESREHVVGNRTGVELLAGRLRAAHPRANLEALRAEPGADGDLVLHAERLRPHPGDLRPDRQDVAVARRAQEPRAGLDDRDADDVVLGKRLGPRQPERREQRLAGEVVPLEEARVKADARRVDVSPAYLSLGRVLEHGTRGARVRGRRTRPALTSSAP